MKAFLLWLLLVPLVLVGGGWIVSNGLAVFGIQTGVWGGIFVILTAAVLGTAWHGYQRSGE